MEQKKILLENYHETEMDGDLEIDKPSHPCRVVKVPQNVPMAVVVPRFVTPSPKDVARYTRSLVYKGWFFWD